MAAAVVAAAVAAVAAAAIAGKSRFFQTGLGAMAVDGVQERHHNFIALGPSGLAGEQKGPR